VALAREYAGPLASPDRAIEAWVEALVLDPSSTDARDALMNELGATGDAAPLVSALLRIAKGDGPERRTALADLTALAATRLGLPGLAVWAGKAALAFGDDEKLAEHVARALARSAGRGSTHRRAFARISVREGDPAGHRWRSWRACSAGGPERVDEYLEVLRSLLDLPGEHRSWQRTLERVLTREGREDELMARPRARARPRPGRGPRAARESRSPCVGARGVTKPVRSRPWRRSAPLRPAILLRGAVALVLAARRREERTWAHALMRLSAPLFLGVSRRSALCCGRGPARQR